MLLSFHSYPHTRHLTNTYIIFSVSLSLSYEQRRVASSPLSLMADRRRRTVSSPLSLTADGGRRGAAPSSGWLSPFSLTQIRASAPLGQLSPATETLGRRLIRHRLLILPMRRIRVAPTHLRHVLPWRNVDEAQPVRRRSSPMVTLSLSGIAPLLTLYKWWTRHTTRRRRRQPRHTMRRRRRRPRRTWGKGGDGHGARGVEEARGHDARWGSVAWLRYLGGDERPQSSTRQAAGQAAGPRGFSNPNPGRGATDGSPLLVRDLDDGPLLCVTLMAALSYAQPRRRPLLRATRAVAGKRRRAWI
jgi:hypothetical protein